MLLLARGFAEGRRRKGEPGQMPRAWGRGWNLALQVWCLGSTGGGGGVLFEKVCPGAAENEVHFHKVSQVRWVHAAGHKTGALCNTASGWRRTTEGVVTALARRLEK